MKTRLASAVCLLSAGLLALGAGAVGSAGTFHSALLSAIPGERLRCTALRLDPGVASLLVEVFDEGGTLRASNVANLAQGQAVSASWTVTWGTSGEAYCKATAADLDEDVRGALNRLDPAGRTLEEAPIERTH